MCDPCEGFKSVGLGVRVDLPQRQRESFSPEHTQRLDVQLMQLFEHSLYIWTRGEIKVSSGHELERRVFYDAETSYMARSNTELCMMYKTFLVIRNVTKQIIINADKKMN